MTQTNNITCELIPGIGFFAEVAGVEYRSTDGGCWLRSNGNHPGNQMLIALRAAAFEAMGKARDKQDTPDPLADLTPEERKAIEGALRALADRPPEPETFSGDPREWGVGTYRNAVGRVIGVWRSGMTLRQNDTDGWHGVRHTVTEYTRISTTPPRIVVGGATEGATDE